MSTETPKVRFETTLNSVRKEAAKVRESLDKLAALSAQMIENPAPAFVLQESVTTMRVGLAHLKGIFTEF